MSQGLRVEEHPVAQCQPRHAKTDEGWLPTLRQLWRELARALAPTDRLRAELVRSGMTTTDPELMQVSTVQHRMFGLWSGVMRGAGPAAWALSLGLMGGHVALGVGAWSVSFLVGLVVVTRSTAMFARFSGMSVVR